MIYSLLGLFSFGIAAAIAISGDFPALAYLISIALILATIFGAKKDEGFPKNSYSWGILIVLLSFFLNKFIKMNAPFPANLVYFLALVSIGYCSWRIWSEYKK